MLADREHARERLLRPGEGSAGNERFVAACMERLHGADTPEKGLHALLAFLGEGLACDRVYVFEDMDRRYLRNTYEWCRPGVDSGIEQLAYVTKEDLDPWYGILTGGNSVIQRDVDALREEMPLIYGFLHPQGIRSLVLTPLMDHGEVCGLLGADNPPAEKLGHISVVFGVLAYFVSTLLGQRDLARLRTAWGAPAKTAPPAPWNGKTVLLTDGSPQLLDLGERVLHPAGYRTLRARTLAEAGAHLAQAAPDAVVLETDLPDGDGLAFGRALRARGVPVVYLTAHTGLSAKRRDLNAQGCAFITKPYRLEELRAAVAAACGSEQRERIKEKDSEEEEK